MPRVGATMVVEEQPALGVDELRSAWVLLSCVEHSGK
jgi:hypothetical protein